MRNGWRVVLLLLAAAVLLGIMASASRAESAWVHGIVQDDAYESVVGGTIWLEREHNNRWYPYGDRVVMKSQSFGWDVRQAGTYRVVWKLTGYETVWIRDGEFTVPGAPTGDIVVNVRRIIAPTPTIGPTATPDVACLGFQQFSYAERRSVVATAASYIGRELEAVLEWDTDPTLIHGLNEQLLGAPVTVKFTVLGLTARAFCNGILTMRPEPREECLGYGLITWDATQNWMVK